MISTVDKEAFENEAYQDFDYQRFKGIHEEGRLRRVPDILPVCMQDFLYGRQPEM